MSVKKKELGYPEEERSLIIMDTCKNQDSDEMKQLSTKNNCELVIVQHNLTKMFQPLGILGICTNQAEKNYISNKFNFQKS